MMPHKREFKMFYYNFKSDIKCLNPAYNEYKPYGQALHTLFNAFDLYQSLDSKISQRYIEKVLHLVIRNNITDDRIDDNLVKVIRNTGRTGCPDLFFDVLYPIVDPVSISNINVTNLVFAFYTLLIDSMYEWEDNAKDDKLMNPYRNLKLDKFRELMLYVYSINVDNMFGKNRYSIPTDTTKLYILCNILAYIYLYDRDYILIEKFVNNSDYYLEKLRMNGMLFEPGYSKLDEEMGNKFFNLIEDFMTDDYQQSPIL